jgi:hypothetical protein
MNSEGNFKLRQAPQQDAHSVPSLRYVNEQDIALAMGENWLEKDMGMRTNNWTTGRRSLHIQKHTCSSCGYPSASVRKCMSKHLS